MTTHKNYQGPQNWLGKKDLARTIGVKESSIDYLIRVNADFPKARYLGPRMRVWHLEEVERWIEGRREK
jgi:predicted DNA-binding transcriptional regulator AlpA